MKLNLVAPIIGITNTMYTLLSDLLDAEVDGITEEMVNNVVNVGNLLEDLWFVSVSAGDYTTVFGPSTEGSILAFDKTWAEAIEPLTGFMDEDEAEAFIAEIGTLPARVQQINDARAEIKANNSALVARTELRSQPIIASIISRWFVILRWFKHWAVIDDDTPVLYTPTYTLTGDHDNPVLTISSGAIELIIKLNNRDITVGGMYNMPLRTFLMVGVKDLSDDSSVFYCQSMVSQIESLSRTLKDAF